MARIAILGWGSLIWDPGNLVSHVRMPWSLGGPLVPLEFSRISESRLGALTLVIDPENGVNLPTRFVESRRSDPLDAGCDLRTREGTVIKHIGLVDLPSNFVRSKTATVTEAITGWAREHGFEAVVWTDLRTNFLEKKGTSFSVEKAIAHLKGLPQPGASEARRYISNAPPEVETPLRRALDKDSWLGSEMN